MTEDLARRAADGGRLAIDTEFVSEGRYQAQLCLAQVAVPDPAADGGTRTEVLDPLTHTVDAGPLAGVLADREVEVVLHAGRQDVAILRRTWATDVTNVFDTQVAAGFLGYGPQEGYSRLVRRVLGVNLEGAEGFTRWDRRPLSPAQLEYAREDAACLLELGSALERDLAERGRLEWAREECRTVEASSDERDLEDVYRRLPRVARLAAKSRAVAWELVEWRDRTARAIDRPPTSVLPDRVLVEVARRMPESRGDLEHIRALPAQTLHRRRAELLDAVRRGRDRTPPPVPPERPPGDPNDAPLVSLAQALVRHRSLESGVAAELIATQAELQAVVGAVRRGEDDPDARVVRGWRRDLVGAELLELLAGRRALRVGEGRLEVG